MSVVPPVQHYDFHGLLLACPLTLTGLASLATERLGGRIADVIVKIGPVPVELEGKVRVSEDYQVGDRKILLTVPDVGRFLAIDGTKLTIQPFSQADAGALELFLIGSGLAAILHQRALLPLHACAIAHEGQCIAFLGDSGAGKSTLAGILSQRGFALLSDDVLVSRTAACGVLAEPSLPILKLWPQSLAAAGFDNTPVPFECTYYNKHRIAAPERFASGPLPLARLYFLRWLLPSSSEPEIVPLKGFAALQALRLNVYRHALIEAMGQEQPFIMFAGRLLSHAKAFEFRRSMNFACVDAQVDAVLDHVRRVS